MSEEKHNTGPDSKSSASLERSAMQDSQVQDVHAQLMREKDEPSEGFSPVPTFLLFVFAALCFWGGVYLVEYSHDFRSDVFSPDYAQREAVFVEVPLFDRGKKIYAKQCVACHQASGLGVPGVYPPLAGSEWVVGHQETLSRILINGLNGPIEVAGKKFNGAMPAFGPNGLGVKPKDIAAVLTYIRQEWGNDASDVTETTVTDYYATYGSRGTPWTAAEAIEGLSAEPVPEVVVPVEVEAVVPVEGEAVVLAAGKAAPAAEAPAHH